MIYVDPSNSLRQTLSSVATQAGHQLLACATAGDALRVLTDTQRHHVIIICVATDGNGGLVKEDGLGLVRATRQIPHRQALPILFLIDHHNPELASMALREGVTEVFLTEDNSSIAGMIGKYLQESIRPQLSGRVLLVEDSPVFCLHITQLCQELGMQVDECAATEAGINLVAEKNYQLAIIDVVLDGVQSGLALVRHIRMLDSVKSTIPILVISSYNDAARRIEALRAGADDYLDKPFSDTELIWRMQRIMIDTPDVAGGEISSTDLKRAREEWQRKGLSQREMEICDALIRGHSDKTIAANLGISFWTVRSHVGSIFTKLGLLNRRELLTRYLPGRSS